MKACDSKGADKESLPIENPLNQVYCDEQLPLVWPSIQYKYFKFTPLNGGDQYLAIDFITDTVFKLFHSSSHAIGWLNEQLNSEAVRLVPAEEKASLELLYK